MTKRIGWILGAVAIFVGYMILRGRKPATGGVNAPVAKPPSWATGGAPYQMGAAGYGGTEDTIAALSGAITGIAGALSGIGSRPTAQPWEGSISDGYIAGFPDTGNSLQNILNPGLDYSQAGSLGN